MGQVLKQESLLDWPRLIQFKKTFTDPFSQKRKKSLVDAEIEVFEDQAEFVDSHTLRVGTRTVEASNIVIAAGAKPRPLKIEGAHHVITSDQFLEYENLPPSILFIGGGYISFEFAQIAAGAATNITILHLDDQPLSMFDKDLVDNILKIFEEKGIKFMPNCPAKAVQKQGDKIIVSTDNKSFVCDLAIHGAGRVADIYDLNLEAANVEYVNAVKVNSFMQSVSSPHIYAAGDCAQSGPQLTPVASMEGKIAALNIVENNSHKVDHSFIPSVAFTMPPLARVGKSEDEANQEQIDYEVEFTDTSSWYNSRRLGLKHTGFKVLKEKNTGKILGAHILYPQAENLINVFSLALKNGLTTQQIKDAVFTYPSDTNDIKYMI